MCCLFATVAALYSRHGAKFGLLSKHKTDRPSRGTRDKSFEIFQHCFSEEVGIVSSSAVEPCSWGTLEDAGYDNQGHEGVFTLSRSDVAFACELSSISVKETKATV